MAKHKSYTRMRRSAITWMIFIMQAESWYSKFTAPLAYKKGVNLMLKQYPKLPVRDVRSCVGKAMLEVAEQTDSPSPSRSRGR